MNFSCESSLKYQCMSRREFSSFVVGELDFILGILNEAKRSVLTKTETVQRVYNLARIVWQSRESFSNIADLINRDDIHDYLLNWTLNTPPIVKYDLIKVAVGRLLCSMCSIKPDLYDRILTGLNIFNDNHGSGTRPYIFRHVVPNDIEVVGNSEHASASIDLKSVDLSENIFKTLSVISLSCIPANKLIHSNFLLVLMDLSIDFIIKDKSLLTASKPHPVPYSNTFKIISSVLGLANSLKSLPAILNYLVRGSGTANDMDELSKINIDSLSLILNFFADLCWQNILRKWMCSERNIVLWKHILHYLCIEVPRSQKGTKYMLPSNPNAKSMHKLEESAINFFSKCCIGHFQNQEKFAEVFSQVLQQGVPKGADPPGLSYFTRRVMVELIISPGYIYVLIETDLPEGLSKFKTNDVALLLPPLEFQTAKQHQLLNISVDCSCADILRTVKTNRGRKIIAKDSTDNLGDNLTPTMSRQNCMPSTSKQSLDMRPNLSSRKRISNNNSAPPAKKKKISDDEHAYKLMFRAPNMCQFVDISQHWSISEIMQVFVPSGNALEDPVLKFFLSKQDSNDQNEEIPEIKHLVPPPAIHKFLDLEAFKFIASNVEKKLAPAFPLTLVEKRFDQIPMHTVFAFGQFLRLPEYRNNPETKSVLRSIICSGKKLNFDSKLFSRVFTQDISKLCNPLMVLPFELLRLTFSRSYKKGADFASLDRSNAAAIDFVLMNLAVFTHQPEKKDCEIIHKNKIYLETIRQCYSTRNKCQREKHGLHLQANWPQGIGYSTSANQSKKFLHFSQIVEEEELITVLLMVLGNYICPGPFLNSPLKKSSGKYEQDTFEMKLMRPLPPATVEQIRKSCLLQVIIGYLKNDSVFDMVKHIPLYKAILFVVRTMVSNVQLAPLILNTSDSEQESIPNLIVKLKMSNQEFLCRTKTDQPSTSSNLSPDNTYCDEIIFFEDILNTANIIDIKKSNIVTFVNAPTNITSPLKNKCKILTKTTQKDYIKIMKQLQYGEYQMIAEGSDGANYFKVPYHFQVRALQPQVTIPGRMKRLAMEICSLASSLPICHESAIFVQLDESRLDVMKVLITGPADTPYMNGCFEFDILCPNDYPNNPVQVNFQTTGKGTVRFNPNLYESGKVCLSLLNTWSGEQWDSQTSSLLQVLVSIQGMIFIPEPYFNEPGFEKSCGTSKGQKSSKSYNDKLLPCTVEFAMIDQINSPSACFEKIIHTHFYLKKQEIKKQVADWINQSTGPSKQILQAQTKHLYAALDKLKLPV